MYHDGVYCIMVRSCLLPSCLQSHEFIASPVVLVPPSVTSLSFWSSAIQGKRGVQPARGSTFSSSCLSKKATGRLSLVMFCVMQYVQNGMASVCGGCALMRWFGFFHTPSLKPRPISYGHAFHSGRGAPQLPHLVAQPVASRRRRPQSCVCLSCRLWSAPASLLRASLERQARRDTLARSSEGSPLVGPRPL